MNGNTAGKVAVGPVTVQGINWAPGTDLWVRWLDPRNSGNKRGLGIDNLSFSADVPEPASMTMLADAAAMLMRRRSR